MKSRLFPVLIAVSVFIVAALVGRYLILPALHGRTVTAQATTGAPAGQRGATASQIAANNAQAQARVQNQSPFDECMDEALKRRVDPIEARHTCAVIADNI